MLHNPAFRRVPAGVIAILALLCGTIIAQQVVPASSTPKDPAAPSSVSIVKEPVPTAKPVVPAAKTKDKDKGRDKGNDKEALIAQALEQPTTLEIKDKTIGEALDLITEKTGVPIEIEPGTYAQLPEDSHTKFASVTIPKKPLRVALAALLRPIALTFSLESERLVIRPTPPLRRIPQRATWQELSLLEKLASTKWCDDLAKDLKFQFHSTPVTLADVNRKTLMELAAKAGDGTASDVLELATNHYGWTWHVAGDTIVVLPKTREIELQLERRITADYTGISVQDTLLDLAQKAGVSLRCDPGVFSSLSPFVAERFSLKVDNKSISQTLNLLVGQTGLNYYVEPEGLRITSSNLGPEGTPTTPISSTDQTTSKISTETVKQLRENSVVIQLELPPMPDGRRIVVMVRRNDLPEDLRPLINEAIKASAEPIRVALKATIATTRPHD